MRVTTSKSKNSESFYINYAYIGKNGKNTSKVFKKLGTLKELSEKLNTDRDGVMAWAKEQARIETEKHKLESENVSVDFHPNRLINSNEQRSFNCGYLFLQSICKSLRFDNICRNIKTRHNYEYNLQSILQDLIYARILSPSSKKSSFEFAENLLEQPKYELHDVYRALSTLSVESDFIQAELYKNSHFIHNRNTKILYYDCTNYFFEIEEADELRKYGKSKEHRPNPIIGMGLFMDADGIPLSFDIYPGNQNEQLSLKPLERKIISDFECSEFIYCSDSGLASKSNKKFNNTNGRHYVITQSLKKLNKEDREIALKPTQYRKIGSTKFIDLTTLNEQDEEVISSIYYKEVPIERNGICETLIVTYSPKYKRYQRNIRNEQIKRAENMISNNSKFKKEKRNPNDPGRFIKKTATTEHGEAATETYYEIDESVISNEEMYDGFYAVTTDLEGDISEIIKINKQRWQIEECFKIMKTEFEARPVYLQREDRIKAHFLICFVSLMIYRLLEIKLEKNYTTRTIINTLRNMKVCKIDEYGYIPTYTRNDLTDKLHELFGFRTDTEIIKKSKMRSIIKESKILR